KCQLVTVRETISQKMLSEIGVNSELFPDLGFSLERGKGRNTKVEKLKEKHKNKKFVAITARPYRFPNSDNPSEKYEEYINGIVTFSEWLFKNNFLPIFVEHTLSDTTHENDGTAISEIVSSLKDDQYEIVSDDDYNCK